MTQTTKKCKLIDWLLLLTIIATTGATSFFTFGGKVWFLLPVVLWIFHRRRLTMTKGIKVGLWIMAALILAQSITFDGIQASTFSYFLRFVTLALCAVILYPNLKYMYVKLMFYICAIALGIWVIDMLIPPVHSLLLQIGNSLPELRSQDFLEDTSNPGRSLYIYNVSSVGSPRNSGPFWEPGVFAIFSILALCINVFNGDKLFSKTNLIFIGSVLSTISTTGYVALLLLFVCYLFLYRKGVLLKLLSIITLPFLIYGAFSLDFMAEKISNQMTDSDTLAFSRFGAMIYHWEKIQQSPLIGFGIAKTPETKMDIIMQGMGYDHTVSPNGISIMAVIWGIPFAVFYFLCIYKSMRSVIITNRKALLLSAFLVTLTTLFSQDLTNRNFFYMFLFIGMAYLFRAQDGIKLR